MKGEVHVKEKIVFSKEKMHCNEATATKEEKCVLETKMELHFSWKLVKDE